MSLVGRSEVQARDLFGLHLLFSKAPSFKADANEREEAAAERAVAISQSNFTAQVVAFLEPEHQALWKDRASFDQLQLEVLQRLEGK